jgi:hypothetical protein
MFQDAAGTIPAAVDAPVGRINDKSGRGNHLTQATAAAQPMLRRDPTSALLYLEFDGVDDWLDGGTGLGLGMGTQGLFCVLAARLGAASNQFICGRTRAASAAGRWSLLKEAGALSAYQDMAAVGANKSVAFSATDDRLWTGKLHRNAGSNRLRLNGVTQSPDVAHTAESTDWTSVHRFTVGGLRNADDTAMFAGYFLAGRVYGIIIKRAASPSDTEISSSETFLAGKSGVVL